MAPHAAAETTAFLDWLAADNFTLLGVSRTDLDSGAVEGLGLLRDPKFAVWGDDALPAPVQKFLDCDARHAALVTFVKSGKP